MQARNHARQDIGHKELALLLQDILRLGVEIHRLDGAGRLEDHEAAQVQREFGEYLLEVLAVTQQFREDLQDILHIACSERLRHLVDPVVADEAEDLAHALRCNGAVCKRCALVEDGERIAHAAVSLDGNHRECLILSLHLHLLGNVAQAALDLPDSDALEVVALAARLDCRRDLVGLCRREDKDDMRRRLFQRLEERIESLRRQHVDLIDDVDLIAAVDRRELDRLSQIADLVDAAVGCRIDLEDVHRRALCDLAALLALPAGFRCRPVLAVERLREDLRRTRLARAARAGKEVCMADVAARNGICQRPADMLLPHEVLERLRPPLPIQRNIRHRNPSPLYD